MRIDLDGKPVIIKRRLRHEAADHAGFKHKTVSRATVLEVTELVALRDTLAGQRLDHARRNVRHADEHATHLADGGIVAINDNYRTCGNRGDVTLRVVQSSRVFAFGVSV